MDRRISPRELAYCGLLGAAALLLPVLFHVVRLGHVFMPMYLPLMTLPFLVRPVPAMVTALLAPLLSGALTGMPPFYPPVALFMALELALMAGLASSASRHWPRARVRLVLVPVLLIGRALHVGLVYLFSLAIALPAGFLAGLSFLSGWPGIILMIAVIPAVVKAGQRASPLESGGEGSPR
jgi:hypothetical protein